jgi:hypothetical protein
LRIVDQWKLIKVDIYILRQYACQTNRENGAKESYVLNFKLTNQVFQLFRMLFYRLSLQFTKLSWVHLNHMSVKNWKFWQTIMFVWKETTMHMENFHKLIDTFHKYHKHGHHGKILHVWFSNEFSLKTNKYFYLLFRCIFCIKLVCPRGTQSKLYQETKWDHQI